MTAILIRKSLVFLMIFQIILLSPSFADYEYAYEQNQYGNVDFGSGMDYDDGGCRAHEGTCQCNRPFCWIGSVGFVLGLAAAIFLLNES
jgi:hypothetical protein